MLELLIGLKSSINPDFKKAYSIRVEGKPYYLIAHWVIRPLQRIDFKDVMLKDTVFRTTTEDAMNYPVLENLKYPNHFKKWLYVSEHPSWVNLYGNWMIGDVYPEGSPVQYEFPVLTEQGAKVVYPRERAWPSVLIPDWDHAFSLWTHPSNQGPCGGQNVVGRTRMCPFIGEPSFNHEDTTSRKFIFLGG